MCNQVSVGQLHLLETQRRLNARCHDCCPVSYPVRLSGSLVCTLAPTEVRRRRLHVPATTFIHNLMNSTVFVSRSTLCHVEESAFLSRNASIKIGKGSKSVTVVASWPLYHRKLNRVHESRNAANASLSHSRMFHLSVVPCHQNIKRIQRTALLLRRRHLRHDGVGFKSYRHFRVRSAV